MNIRKAELFLLAGVVWTVAGLLVMKIGYPVLLRVLNPTAVIMAISVCLIFYLFIFSKIVKKHDRRIEAYPEKRLPFYLFFDRPSYIVMLVMMIGGILLRTSGIMPDILLGPFYIGLGFALFSCGLRFLLLYMHKRTIIAQSLR